MRSRFFTNSSGYKAEIGPTVYNSFGDKQIKFVGGGTCLKCLSPLRKTSASLGIRSVREKTPESKKLSLKPVALTVKRVGLEKERE